VSIELGRRLIAAGAVHPSEIEAAFYRQLIAGIPFVRAILELGHITEEALEQELAASMAPFLATIIPLPALVDELPQQMCRRLMAVPVRRDPRTGLVDVAAVDPFDAHIVYEFSYHLKSEVRILRGSLASIEHALGRIDRGEYSASVILRKSVRPPGYATPSAPPLRSDRPIPLVRKSKRRQSVEVHAVRDIAGPPQQREGARPDYASPDVPPAPSMPSFGQGASQPGSRPRQRTAPGPPGVPARQEPPAVPSNARGRPEIPSASPSSRRRPEVPGASPVSGHGLAEISGGTSRSRPEVPSTRGRPEVPGATKPRPETSGAPPSPAKTIATSSSGDPSSRRPRARAQGGPPPPPATVPTPASSAGARRTSSPAPSPEKRVQQGARPSPAPATPGAKRRSSSPPSTSRGPFSPKAPVAPFPDIHVILTAMESAVTRDEVIDCLIVGMSTVARRVGVFAVKKGCYRGVACNRGLGDAARFRGIEISAEATTVLGIAATSGSYLGPLPVTQPHEDLLAFMKDVSNEVCASLIRVAGRPALILLAEGLGDTMIATRRAEELGREASVAFSRILTEAKAGRGRS
jgi:hypothetical protein